MKVFAPVGKKRMNLHRIFDLNFADRMLQSNYLASSMKVSLYFLRIRF